MRHLFKLPYAFFLLLANSLQRKNFFQVNLRISKVISERLINLCFSYIYQEVNFYIESFRFAFDSKIEPTSLLSFELALDSALLSILSL